MKKNIEIRNHKDKIDYQKHLLKYFKGLNIKKKDTLLLHSDISILKNFNKNLDLREMLEILIKTLTTMVGKKGTLVFPAYYYEFQKKNFFDISNCISSELGILPKYINSLNNSFRSLNPVTSVVAIGYNAKKICNNNYLGSYGLNSPFDILTKLKSKMLFFGTDLSKMTYVHYVEFLLAVPHRYNKYVKLKIKNKNKKLIEKKITIYVRYKNTNTINNPVDNYNKFKNLKTLIIKKINGRKSYIINFEDIFTHLEKSISKNYFYLLKTKPKFNNSDYPLI
jgi:aminoglycoside N3'-acetyltransferase